VNKTLKVLPKEDVATKVVKEIKKRSKDPESTVVLEIKDLR
jgi:hypothetical protein